MTAHTPGAMRALVRLPGFRAMATDPKLLKQHAAIISEETGDADLLAALEHLIDDAENHQDGDDRSMTLDVTIARARAAIAKARVEG